MTRPAELLYGHPIGAIDIRFSVDDVGATYGIVECYNGMTKKSTFLKVDGEKAAAIDSWLKAGKPGNIQDSLPQLTVDECEQLISGITPAEWKDIFGEEND